jgi:hypothetical protein
MSNPESAGTPLWLRGRDAVVAATSDAEWRSEKPDYAISNERLAVEKTHQFAADSLEGIVESLVQVFEMEVSHKKDPTRWVSMVNERFRTRVNGGAWADAAAIAERGSYNILIGDNLFYAAEQESFDSSHETFHRAFPGGFLWEVLEVYSAPPVVSFKWRHWGSFQGEYKGFAPNGKTVELFGVSVARCSESLQLLEVEHFYDNSQFLSKLTGGCPVTRRVG